MSVIKVKSMDQVVYNFRSLSAEDVVARATKPDRLFGNKWFAIEGNITNDRGVNATAEFRVLGLEETPVKGIYRVTYKGIFFELGNGYRCLELKYHSETPRLCINVKLTDEEKRGLMEHYKFH